MGPDYQTAEVKLRNSRVASEKLIKYLKVYNEPIIWCRKNGCR